MPQEDHGTCELNHAEEILWVILPANNDATIVMEPSKQTCNFPATTVAAQGATVLGDGSTSVPAVRRDPRRTVRVPVDPTDHCRTLCRRSIAPAFAAGIGAAAWVRRAWLHSAKRRPRAGGPEAPGG